MTVIFVEPVGEELQDAVDYYNAQTDGLGLQFYDCFQDTIRYITAAPVTWRLVGEEGSTFSFQPSAFSLRLSAFSFQVSSLLSSLIPS